MQGRHASSVRDARGRSSRQQRRSRGLVAAPGGIVQRPATFAICWRRLCPPCEEVCQELRVAVGRSPVLGCPAVLVGGRSRSAPALQGLSGHQLPCSRCSMQRAPSGFACRIGTHLALDQDVGKVHAVEHVRAFANDLHGGWHGLVGLGAEVHTGSRVCTKLQQCLHYGCMPLLCSPVQGPSRCTPTRRDVHAGAGVDKLRNGGGVPFAYRAV
mmetsp:Transcript_47757/g.138016  ORF Transcript_47757/g.138016 Transcript_47757/m.138016 type:complete len:213 (-) Transcript_47757:1623-2261(-)